jgi:hypothetical protein
LTKEKPKNLVKVLSWEIVTSMEGLLLDVNIFVAPLKHVGIASNAFVAKLVFVAFLNTIFELA